MKRVNGGRGGGGGEADKTLRRIPANAAKRIRAKIKVYAEKPENQKNNVSKLQNRPGYKLRIGDWRVAFGRNGNVLAILAIGPRGGIYED